MAAWTYSNWVTYDVGPTRLSQLRLHVKEVSDKLGSGSYSVPGFSTSKSELVTYLEKLQGMELKLSTSPVASSTPRSRFTRGHPLR